MPDTNLMIGRDLGQAICKHFSLSANQVQSDYKINTDLYGLVSINLTISLTPDDLAGIARAAGIVGEQGPELVNLDPPSRVYTPDETRDILRRYAAGTKAATQDLTLKVDASEAAALLKEAGDDLAAAIRAELRELRKELQGVSQMSRHVIAPIYPGE